MGYVIMHSPFHFSSDSDAAFRRDRLRMVWRPCAVRHTFWLCTGFTRARYVHDPTESHTGDKNYAAHSCSCRGFRVGSPPETFDHSPFKYHGRLLRATNHEPRPFGLRCGVPPRQIQTNNDASGSPQRVAGRPPLLSILITGSVSDGPERLWDGPYGIAVRRWK